MDDGHPLRRWDHGRLGWREGVDDADAQRHEPGIGAEIMGADLRAHPPARPSVEREGGTTFHFLDAPPARALDIAREAAAGLDVRIGGGPTRARDFIAAGLVDHIHLVQVPIVLGRGVRLWGGSKASMLATTSRRSPRRAGSRT